MSVLLFPEQIDVLHVAEAKDRAAVKCKYVRNKLANLKDCPVLLKVWALPAITPAHIRAW